MREHLLCIDSFQSRPIQQSTVVNCLSFHHDEAFEPSTAPARRSRQQAVVVASCLPTDLKAYGVAGFDRFGVVVRGPYRYRLLFHDFGSVRL